MDAARELNALLSFEVVPFLAERGFRRRGIRFRAMRGENEVFVQFQRRGKMFTADLGVISALLIRLEGQFPLEHFRARLGPLAVGYDRWWDLDADRHETGRDLRFALEHGLSQIEPLLSDKRLRDRLLTDTMAPGWVSPIEQGWAAALIRALGTPAWLDAGPNSRWTTRLGDRRFRAIITLGCAERPV